MSSLRELQHAFAANLLAVEPPPAPAYLRHRGAGGTQRLNVYRHNVRDGFTEALQAAYPVVERLVGAGFFGYAAERFVRETPARHGDLIRYGEGFAGFLERLPEASSLPYLPDVARLEWALQVAYHAADRVPLVPATLARLTPTDAGRLRLRLHPAVTLLDSPYPVTRIWQVNQPGYAGEDSVRLDEGGARIMVHRDRDGTVGWHALRPGAWSLLTALAAGRPLETACEAALAAEPETALDRIMAALVADGVIVDCKTGATGPVDRPPPSGSEIL